MVYKNIKKQASFVLLVLGLMFCANKSMAMDELAQLQKEHDELKTQLVALIQRTKTLDSSASIAELENIAKETMRIVEQKRVVVKKLRDYVAQLEKESQS